MLTTSFLGATLLSDFSQNVEAPTGQTANGLNKRGSADTRAVIRRAMRAFIDHRVLINRH